jgi:hypothetical protein
MMVSSFLYFPPEKSNLQLAGLERALDSVGYSGRFRGKPDSPCLYLPGNNGPDGCAIFVRRARFQILSEHSRVLEVWRVPSNQVLFLNFKKFEERNPTITFPLKLA